jgi:hypothetical protein
MGSNKEPFWLVRALARELSFVDWRWLGLSGSLTSPSGLCYSASTILPHQLLKANGFRSRQRKRNSLLGARPPKGDRRSRLMLSVCRMAQ